MERPLITVIVLVYNAGDYLGPCLESISRQTMTDFELLLVDNGSTDGSGEACDAFALAEPRCRVIHQENLGIIGGRGAGVRAARGEYLAFVDSDDLLHRRMLEVLAESCRSTGLPVACCRFLPFLGEQPPEVPDEPGQLLRFEAPRQLDALLHDKRVEYSLCNKLYHRGLFEGFDFSSPVIYNEDLYLNWHILQRVKGMAFVDLVGYFYRQHAASTTHRPLNRRALEDQLFVASTILAEAEGGALEPTEENLQAYAQTHGYTGLSNEELLRYYEDVSYGAPYDYVNDYIDGMEVVKTENYDKIDVATFYPALLTERGNLPLPNMDTETSDV